MKDKNGKVYIAVALNSSAISFYSVTVHEDDVLGIVSAEEYEQLQHESHVNQKDLRAYIDSDGIRKIGSFDNMQPTLHHKWSEKKADWVISASDKKKLKEEEEERSASKLNEQISHMRAKMQEHLLMGEEEEAKALVLEIRALQK